MAAGASSPTPLMPSATATPPTPPAPRSVPVSVLIPAKNEASNIVECLASVAFASEVVVVDSQSSDGTIAMAEAHGARVVQFHWDGKFPKKKNWALANVEWANEWVLILDADERIVPELAQEIAEVIARTDANAPVGYYLNRRFMFMGGWLRHCGYYPSWNLRLFRHRLGRYEKVAIQGEARSGDNEVHEHVLMEGGEEGGRVGYLKADMLHYAYPAIDIWVEKHNRYSNWEARAIRMLHSGANLQGTHLKASLFGNALERKRWIRKVAMKLPFRPTLRFIYHYILKKGFLDGYRGYVFCRLLMWYEFLSIAKAHELKQADAEKSGTSSK